MNRKELLERMIKQIERTKENYNELTRRLASIEEVVNTEDSPTYKSGVVHGLTRGIKLYLEYAEKEIKDEIHKISV